MRHKMMRIAVGTGIIAVVMAGTGFPAADTSVIPQEALNLIDKHVSWLGGWEALDNLRDLSFDGQLEVSKLSGPLAVRLRRDDHSLLRFDLKVIKGAECLTGETGWEINASGQLEDMGLHKIRDQRRSLARVFGRHLRGEGVRISVLPTGEEKAGRTWAVVRFDYPDGDSFDLFVDPVSGESLWSRRVEDGRSSWSLSSDFRTVGGLRFAFREETLHENPLENQVVTWEKVTINVGAADALFTRPEADRTVARLTNNEVVTEWIPVELYRKRWLFIRGTVNGREVDIVLDSGAGITVLDQAAADLLGLTATGKVAAQGTGGTTAASLVDGVTLRLGQLEIGPLAAAVIDLSDVSRRIGRSMPVILGKEVFHALLIDVDYPNSRIRFHDPSFTYAGPGRRFDLIAAEDGHKDVRLSVEALPPAVFALDTGQGGEVTLFRHYSDENDLLAGRRLSERKGGGVGGSAVYKLGTLKSLTIAGFEFADVPASFQRDDVRGAFDTKRQAGNLGTGILRRFRVLFDYPHNCLWLEPGPDFDAPFPREKTGLTVAPEGSGLVVMFVAPGSPAAETGWSAGERIVAINGKEVDTDWWKIWTHWEDSPGGATVLLTMADGSERSLTLKEYY